MAKSKKSGPAPAASDASPTFEESLAELQQIVAELEGGALGLAESMQRFERGIALLRNCYDTLENAEQKIEILTGFDAEGNAETQPFDAAATLESSQRAAKPQRRKKKKSSDPPADAEPDDGSLF